MDRKCGFTALASRHETSANIRFRSAETVQTGKKLGMQVAAYMILVKLGLTERIC